MSAALAAINKATGFSWRYVRHECEQVLAVNVTDDNKMSLINSLSELTKKSLLSYKEADNTLVEKKMLCVNQIDIETLKSQCHITDKDVSEAKIDYAPAPTTRADLYQQGGLLADDILGFGIV